MAVHPLSSTQPRTAASRLESPNLAKEEAINGRVQDSPRGNYILAHPKDEWQLSGDGELFPVLVPLSKLPGVQGCDRRGNWSAAHAYYMEQGFTLIPHDVIPSDYVALYLNTKGQRVHRSVFQTPLDGPNGTVWVMDEDSWRKFVQLLRVKGLVKAPRPHILRGMLHTTRETYLHLRPPAVEDASRRDSYDRQVTMYQKQIACLERELEGSIEEHGEDRSPAHNTIGSLLDEALGDAQADRDALEAARTPAPPKSVKKSHKKKVPAPKVEPEIEV